jgi:trimeric autotransporter adhesin
MASTYVNDLRLNEMATGDASGSWGTVTNTNLELIGEAFSYGTETIGDADSTLTIADGAADAARSFYLKITSSVDLTTTRIVTLGPNTVSKVWMIENATTGSQVITIKQGSGATINVPNGQVKMISTDGAGSGGAVLDLLVDVDLTGTTTLVNLDVSGAVDIAGDLTLSAGGDGALRFTAASSVKVLDNDAAALVFEEADNAYMTFVTTDGSEAVKFDKALDINAATQIDATVTVGVDDTGYDVKFFGATAGAYMLWDESADDLILGGAAGLSVNSTALVTGVLTTTAATVSNGGGQFNGAINVGVDDTGYDVKFFGATTGKSLLWDESADSLTVAGNLSVDGGTIKLDGNYPVGANNVALGNAAFDSVTTGDQNVAIGASALTATTDGRNNTAIGEEALAAATDGGTLNAAFGSDTMKANTTGDNNVAVGAEALFSNTTASNNTAVGYQAGYTNTTGEQNAIFGTAAMYANTTGTMNTAIGKAAMTSNTTGNYNTAIGKDALVLNTTASNNTAVGYQAAYSNTTGADLTAIGYQALDANTTGNYSTAVGYSALGANTEGSANEAFGREALRLNTTGSNNTALGYRTLDVNTSGGNNVAVGQFALGNNTTADNNTAVGYQSLYANTTGTRNTALGMQALKTVITGNYNTAVGYQALELNTGSGNTAVGDQALEANTSGGSNSALGDDALVSNTTGSYNSAFGESALGSNTTASYNTAVGSNALFSNTTGEINVAIGRNAMYDNTTGANNVAVGLSALANNTSGDSNVGLGYQALLANTTASSNTAVGYQALYTNTTATRQVAVGYLALEDSNGNGNIGVGYGAGKDITSGTDNVCVGDLAGSSQGSLTTGAGNVFIGTSAGSNVASAGAAANQISIGYNIQNIGDNYFTFGKGTGSDRVYNQFTANATWTRSSDERLKTQITENTNCGLAFITDLRTVTYKWKAGADIDETLPDYNPEEKEPEYKEKMYGFIAQEVKSAMDKNGITNFAGWDVTPDEQGAMQGVSYEMFVIPLIKAIQEQQATITALTARITALEGA